MKTVISGLGVIGNVHLDVLGKAGVTPAAVCDTDPEKLKNACGIPTYRDYVAMIETEKPDVVHICTPHYLHADMIIEALQRNINVICEKPVCIKYEDIVRILDAEKKSKAQLGVCHQNRYNPNNMFVKEYLKDKKIIGGYGSVFWHRDKEYYSQASWRGRKDTEGGGVLINQALHTLDLLQWLIGMPEELASDISNLSLSGCIEVEDTAAVICRGKTDFQFFATNAGCCDFPVSLTIKTDKEILNILPAKVITESAVYDFEKDKRIYGKCCYGTGHQALFDDFYDCVKTGRKFPIDGRESSKVVKIILAAYRSNGRFVKI